MKLAHMLALATALTSLAVASGGPALAQSAGRHPYPYCQLLQPGAAPANATVPGAAPQQGAPGTQSGASPAKKDEKSIPTIEELAKTTTNPTEIVDTILSAAAPKTPEEFDAMYAEIYNLVVNTYVERDRLANFGEYEAKFQGKIKTYGDLRNALREMFAAVDDRWTKYSDPSESLSMMLSTERMAHFGAFVRANPDGTFFIEHIEPGSSAQESGLREDDTIISINGIELAGKSKAEADRLFKTPAGERLTIVSIQDGKQVTAEYTVRPISADASAPKAALIGGNIAYIKLPSFMSIPEFNKLTDELIGMIATTPGGAEGIILDLRYNGGGMVEMAKVLIRLLSTESTFLLETSVENGFLVEKKTSILPLFAFERKKYSARQLEVLAALKQLPLVILINGSSASASEMVASIVPEVRENVTLMGAQSFGKGVEMMSMATLPNCSEITIKSGKYTTPSGKWIQNVGITPDVVVYQVRGARDDTQLDTAVKFIKDKTAKNGSNIVRLAPEEDVKVLGPVAERPKPVPVSAWKQFVSDYGGYLPKVLVGGGLLILPCVFLWFTRRRKS